MLPAKLNKEFKAVSLNKKMLKARNEYNLKSPRLGIYEINKISLPCLDYKGYIVDDGIKALAYDH